MEDVVEGRGNGLIRSDPISAYARARAREREREKRTAFLELDK